MMPPKDDELFIMEYRQNPSAFLPQEQARYIRCLNGLSQRALAEAAGISESSISKYERGLVSMTSDHLIWVCDVLGCTADQYLGRSRYEKD